MEEQRKPGRPAGTNYEVKRWFLLTKEDAETLKLLAKEAGCSAPGIIRWLIREEGKRAERRRKAKEA